MFSIYDGRTSFYQWDIDRKLIVEDSTIKQVHFCNKTDDCSLVCETFTEDGRTIVNVPNILLQSDWRINVYAYDGEATKHCATFSVIGRTKPSDYIYTETEVKNYEQFKERLAAVESGKLDNLSNGQKGFYWETIEKQASGGWLISLSTTNGVYGEEQEFNINDFGWEYGDSISIHNGNKYYYVITIGKVIYDEETKKNYVLITSNNVKAFETIDNSVDHFTDKAIYLPNKPAAGLVEFGVGAIAAGTEVEANNYGATAFGKGNKAVGQYAFTAGRDNAAYHAATAFGRENIVTGEQGFSVGYLNRVGGNNSGAIGRELSVSEAYSFATGKKSSASNNYATAMGCECVASGIYSVAMGAYCKASGGGSFAVGNGSTANGDGAFAESGSTASGRASHAEGANTTASDVGAHSEGVGTQATNDAAHAEGYYSKAMGTYSHAEGAHTTAYGNANHAEGWQTVAGISTNLTGIAGAHAEGHTTTASGQASHAEGKGTIANGQAQHAGGKYNIADSTSLVIIGNGTEAKRSNAYTLDANGNGWFAGTVETTAIILTAPNGTKYKLSVDNSGNLVTAV